MEKTFLQAMRKNFAPYLSYKRDNNELLLFALRALSRDTAAYMRNRYGTEQEVIEIAEGDLLDKVRTRESEYKTSVRETTLKAIL